MSFSSGTFTLVAGNPVVTGTTISSTVQNNTMNDVATGLSTCILKDGTQTATATIPFTNITTSGSAAIGTTLNVTGGSTVANISATSANTTSGNTASTATTVPVTIFNASAIGMYLVTACTSAAGTIYCAEARIVSDGANTPFISSTNGGNLTITMSGSDVQLTQTSGGNQVMSWRYLKIL